MRRIIIATALVVFVLLAGWYEGLYRPEASHINTLKASEQAEEVTVLSLETHYADLVKSKRELPEERAALAKLEQAVPNGPELDNLVKTLFSAALAAGAQLEAISSPQPSGFGSPGAVATTPGPVELSLSLNVTGSTSQIEKLYAILDSEPRLFVINNFSLTSGGSSAGATVELEAFYALPSSTSAASPSPTSAASPSPTRAASPSHTRAPSPSHTRAASPSHTRAASPSHTRAAS